MWITSGTRLRVNGDFRVSRPFSLPPQPSVRLRVSPSSSGVRALGFVLIGVSSPFLFIGSLLAVGDSNRAGETFLTGLVGLATGLTLVLVTGSSSVRLSDPPPVAGAARGRAPWSRTAVASPRVDLGRGLSLSPTGLHF